MTVAGTIHAIPIARHPASVAKVNRAPLVERAIFLAVLGSMVLAFGAADALPLSMSATALFGLAGWLVVSRPVEPALRPVVSAALGIATLLALWVVIQSVLPVSGAPADSQAAIVPIMLPFAVFVIALLLWPTDGAARELLQVIGVGGALLAAYGVAQLSLSPGKVLFVRPTPHLDSLTATLMSPDAAALVLGSIVILLAVRSVELIRRVLEREGSLRDVLRVLLFGGSTLVVLAGLLLTQSRVGIGATVLGLAFALGLTAAFPSSKRTHRNDRHPTLKRVGAGVFAAAITVLSIGLLAARTLAVDTSSRGELDAGCELPSLLRMLADHWVFGAGAGTFDTAVLAYANPTCGLSRTGVTDHSGFLIGWVSLGLPFVAGTLAAGVVLALILIRGLSRRRRMRWAPIAGMSVIVTAVISLTWTSSAFVPAVAAVIATILAAICAICLNDAQHNQGGSS